MSTTILTSRALNQDVAGARKAAEVGPVIITDRGKPSYVLMTYHDFLRLSGGPRSLARALAMPGLSVIDFDPPRSDIAIRDLDVS